MNKEIPPSNLYFRTVLYSCEDLMPTADFKIIEKHILRYLDEKATSFLPKINLPKEIHIQPIQFTQFVFQLQDIPKRQQRNVLAVLLTKFPFLSCDFLKTIMSNEHSYINITYTKYNNVYKVRVALERIKLIIEEKTLEEHKQERLAVKRRINRKFSPNAKTRRLRARTLKRLKDWQMLELVEKAGSNAA